MVSITGRSGGVSRRTSHGLARHNATFVLISTEDPNGFEAQNRKNEELRIKNERHEMKKEHHERDILKDGILPQRRSKRLAQQPGRPRKSRLRSAIHR
jgi:NAD(P)-dependent dehydrogenase (short-subunit alcohol dehydrogenase family)